MKRALGLLGALALCACAWAYNPPFAGESVFYFSGPELLSGAGSATGGPLGIVVPASITFNPAIPALSQRTAVNLGYAVAFDTKADSKTGHFAQAGLIYPTKWCVLSGTVQGTFANMARMDLGDSIIVHAGASKDITERLLVGANLYTGFYFAHGFDFSVGLDAGFVYYFDDMGILKSPRLGVALLNLGKPLTNAYAVTGVDGTQDKVSFPSAVTPRASFAATLFEGAGFTGAFSADISTPLFQNVVLDTAFGVSYRGMVSLGVRWSLNVVEAIHGAVSLPAVGLSVRFAINSSRISMNNEDWAKSEVGPSLAWQDMYDGIHVISTGAQLDLGMTDTTAPEIILWGGEE